MSLNDTDARRLRECMLPENGPLAERWIEETLRLQQQLDAANQRIAELEGDKKALQMALESNTHECNHWASQYAQEHEAKEAAERKLADSNQIRAELLSALEDANDHRSSIVLERADLKDELLEAKAKLEDARTAWLTIRMFLVKHGTVLRMDGPSVIVPEKALAQIDAPK